MAFTAKLSLVIFCLGLSGCMPYPVYKKLQPELHFIVVNEADKPIDGARVHLVTSSHPYGYEDSREIRVTQNRGEAKFSDRRRWTTEALIIHGWLEYFWNWCIEKDGYATYQSARRSGGDEKERVNITLKAGVRTECTMPLR